MRVKEVPDLDNVQPFFSDPVLADDVGNTELRGAQPEGSHTQQNRPLSYLYENKASIPEMIINEKVKRALATSWAFNPRACSTGPAQQHSSIPHHGLTEEEYTWTKGHQFSLVVDAIKQKQCEVNSAKQSLDWDKHWITYEPYPSFDGINLDQELDTFYGSGENTICPTTDSMMTDHGQLATNQEQVATDHENVGRDSMSTTWITLPQSNHTLAGPLTSSTFRDSAIHMEDHFAEAANKESPPQSACKIPTEQASYSQDDIYSRYVEDSAEDSLARFEASNQAAFGSGFEAPYDFSGFVSSESDLSEREFSPSVSGDIEMNEDENSAVPPGTALPLVPSIDSEGAASAPQRITLPQHINPLFDGYLHDTTHALNQNLSPFENPPRQGNHEEFTIPDTISQEEFPKLQVATPPFVIYEQNAPSSINLPTNSSMQLLGDLQAHAGVPSFDSPACNAVYHGGALQAHTEVSSFDNPTDNVIHLGGNYQVINPAQTTIARRGEYQNLTPEYDSDSDNNLDHLEPASPITLPDSTKNVHNQALGELNNPYDYRHYLSSKVPQFSAGMDLDFLALSSPYSTNQVSSADIEGLGDNSILTQPSLHSNGPINNRIPSPPTAIPASSPTTLHPYTNSLITPSPVHNTFSTPMHFSTSTPTPIMMANTDPVSPSPAPRKEVQAIKMPIWPTEEDNPAGTNESAGATMGISPQEEDALAGALEGENNAAESSVKDVFGVQQKRKVGRPVGTTKNAKKVANESAEKAGATKPDGEGMKKKATKKAGNTGSDSKKAPKTSSEGSKKMAKKRGVETTLTASATATTAEKSAKPKAVKHKQPATSEESEPKKKRVRRPSRKSVGALTSVK